MFAQFRKNKRVDYHLEKLHVKAFLSQSEEFKKLQDIYQKNPSLSHHRGLVTNISNSNSFESVIYTLHQFDWEEDAANTFEVVMCKTILTTIGFFGGYFNDNLNIGYWQQSYAIRR